MVTAKSRRRMLRARRTGVAMTILLVVSTGLVTSAAVQSGPPTAAPVICPGAAGRWPR